MKKLFENWQKYLEKTTNAEIFVEFLKKLESPQARPSGFKKSSLKREKVGKSCCWCGKVILVGVEHIIPRSAGGPAIDEWNLAWSCYPCNWAREALIDIPPRNPKILNGWLTQEFENFKATNSFPTSEEIRKHFNLGTEE